MLIISISLSFCGVSSYFFVWKIFLCDLVLMNLLFICICNWCVCVCVCVCVCSVTQLCLTLATPWIVALQASLSMGFCQEENWKGLPLSPSGLLPNPGIKPGCSTSPALGSESLGSPMFLVGWYTSRPWRNALRQKVSHTSLHSDLQSYVIPLWAALLLLFW